LGAALAALLIALGAWLDAERMAFAYLMAWSFGLSLALGSLLWIMIENVTGGDWFVTVRRLAERTAGLLPVFAALFLGVLAFLPALYPWAQPELALDPHMREVVQAKSPYFDRTFFVLRAVLYFAVWGATAHFLRRWSMVQDDDASLALVTRQKQLSAGALPAVAFALHFAAVDWLMSLDPAWSSSIFGAYVFAGSALGALALLIVLVSALDARGVLSGVVHTSHYHALGKLLFTILVFWAYVAFFQYFLIWSANIPEEAAWYVERTQGAWRPVWVALMLGHFVVPFFLLLSRNLRRSRRRLPLVAGWLLAMHLLDVYWLVMPSQHGSAWPQGADVAAVLAMLSITIGVLAPVWADAPVPKSDPRLAAAVSFHTQ
jgi:hypothetical protein